MPSLRLRSRRFLGVLQCLAAVLGACAWGAWLRATWQGQPPKTLFFLWLAALLLWGAAFFARWPIRRPDWITAAVGVMIAFMMVPRAVSLAELPYGIALDEILHPLLGLDAIAKGPWGIFSGIFLAHSNVQMVLQAWPCLLFEPLFGARFASLILSVGSLIGTYVLAARLFGRAAGVVAVTILACSFWHILYSRLGYPHMQPMMIVPCALYVCVVGIVERNRFVQFVGGVLLGLALLVYTPARIVVVVFAAWLVHRLLTRHLRVREAVPALAVIAVGAVIVISPYVQTAGLHGLLERYSETTLQGVGPIRTLNEQGWFNAAAVQFVASRLQAALRPYYLGGALLGVSDHAPGPLLDPVTLALSVIGLAIAAVRLRDSNCFLLVVWVGATIIVGQAFTDVPVSAYRGAPVLPALAICAGLAVASVARWVRWARLPGQAYLNVAAVGALLAAILPANLRAEQQYFAQRAHDGVTAIARFIASGSREPIYYVVSPEPYGHGEVFRFLGGDRDIRDVVNLLDTLGSGIEERRDAVFMLSDTRQVPAIVRCYPGALQLNVNPVPLDPPLVALGVSRVALQAGHDCRARAEGPGLLARYFEGPDWTGAVMQERVEDWWLRITLGTERFGSVEWSGSLQLPVSGTYRFQLMVTNGAAEASLGEAVRLSGASTASARLDAGACPISIRCRSKVPGSFCWLRWAPPGGDFETIPPQFLQPPGADRGRR